jgi:hypothetical protein
MKETPMPLGHLEDAVHAVAGLRAEHDRQATPLQKIVERFTARAGSSEFVVALSLIIVSWMVLNTVLLLLGKKPIGSQRTEGGKNHFSIGGTASGSPRNPRSN